MIRKSGNRFSERSCSNKRIERDDDSKKSHRALAQRVRGQLELLDALGVVDFAGIDVALLVDRHGVNPVKLSGVAAAPSEAANHAAIFALQDPDLVVLA